MLCSDVAALVAGDVAVLLAFAAIGRLNHGEPLTLGDTVATALPFAIGGQAQGPRTRTCMREGGRGGGELGTLSRARARRAGGGGVRAGAVANGLVKREATGRQ